MGTVAAHTPNRRGRTGAILFVCIVGCTVFALIATPTPTAASFLDYVSDLLSTSAPTSTANHTITFQLPIAIPPSGRIVITPDPGFFTIPNNLDYVDIDIATSSALTGPYVDRLLAAVPSAAADGVSVATGTSGSLTFTLNSTQGIATSAFVRVLIGTHANSGAQGVDQIVNPSSTMSYRIRIRTENASGTTLNEGTAMVAILQQIFLYADTLDFDPPMISNGMPSGTIPAGIRTVEITVSTDEGATCRYATSSDTAYNAMPYNFTVTGGTLHLSLVSTMSDGTTYAFYVRCVDHIPNANTSSYPIVFTVDNPKLPPGQGGPLPPPGGGGGPPYIPQPPAPFIEFSGRAYPFAGVSVLKDGAAFKQGSANALGDFIVAGGEVAQGTYVFSVLAEDAAKRRSAAYTTSFTIVQGTRNTIANIVVPPTIAIVTSTIAPGEPAQFFGSTAPGAQVELLANIQKRGIVLPSEITKRTATANAAGDWAVALDTKLFVNGIYEAKARTVVPNLGASPYSQIMFFGVGKSPGADSSLRADMNRDGKVNLVDFSILLFHWGTANPIADLNYDGRVNLTDFSILLFAWTG